jgi:CheY-like chemotaxis protein
MMPLSHKLRSMPDSGVILIVEDREDDIVLIRKAFEKASLTNPVQVARDGEEAVAYLGAEGKYANRAEYPLPVIVLLDLKLPRIDGFEVLSWIRQQEGIQGLPVIVLTSSTQIQDVNRAYALGANSFFVKDIDFEQIVNLSTLIRHYWLQKAIKPETYRPDRKSLDR